jgi:radical SAM superfamily enzyme YgiQ (UPF0313 family)
MSKKLKVLLANPVYRIKLDSHREQYFIRAGSRWPFSLTKKIDEISGYLPFPFYLAYTAAMLEKEPGVDVFVRDSIALNETEDEFWDYCLKLRPDIMLFETATNTLVHDAGLAQKIKAAIPGIIIVFSGFHVTALPKETQEIAKGAVDFLLLREYELNFLALVKALRDNHPTDSIPSLATFSGDGLKINDQYIPIDINQLPFPARHLFPSNDRHNLSVYWDGFIQLKPAIQMHASRGCPFRCNFCVWVQAMYDSGKYRPRNVTDICDEMEDVIQKYKAREVYFDDDTFTGSKKHVLQLCDEIVKRGLHKRVKWSAMSDFMITDTEMIRRMHEAGCIGLKFGVESGDEEVLKKINKPINFQRLKENTKLCAKLKIKAHATFTFGGSGENRASLERTLAFAKQLDCDTVQFSLTTPFPGTAYYNELVRENRLASTDWKNFDGNHECVIRYDDMDSEYVSRFHAKAMNEWIRHKLKNPQWIYRQFLFLFRSVQTQGVSLLRLRVGQLFDAVLQR